MIFLPHILSFYHSIVRAMQLKKAFIWSKNLYSCLTARQVSLQFKKYKSLHRSGMRAASIFLNFDVTKFFITG